MATKDIRKLQNYYGNNEISNSNYLELGILLNWQMCSSLKTLFKKKRQYKIIIPK